MGETSSLPGVMIPQWWEETAESIAYDSCSCPPPIVLVCGPGNSGKSTFSRLLLDTLFSRYKRVGYLDTDLGQPEFTAPGCLSLHIINKQTPDLTILCLKTPERCFYFGDLTPKRDTKAFLRNIFSLYDYFCKEYYQSNEPYDPAKPMLPLIVNTSGWVKGIGCDLLVEMLRYIAPTHVVQIRVAAENKNLPNGTFWLDGDQKESVNLFEICAVPKDSSNQIVLKKDARMMRDIRITSYFRQCLPRDLNFSSYKELAQILASIPPYEVPFSRVKVERLHSKVSSSETYHGLKDTIVGLAVSSWRPPPSECCMPWCIGLGIVRAVDISRDLVYVVTPVPIYSLEKVDLLLLGYIEIPACLVQVDGCLSPQTSINVPHKLETPKMDVQVAMTQKMFSEVLSV